jgi:hypothetical protein
MKGLRPKLQANVEGSVAGTGTGRRISASGKMVLRLLGEGEGASLASRKIPENAGGISGIVPHRGGGTG